MPSSDSTAGSIDQDFLTEEARRSAFPETALLRQTFPFSGLADAGAAVRAELEALPLRDRLSPGQTVGIAAGSRGVANIAEILRAVADSAKAAGAKPFIFAAMGSHGGASAEGQRRILEKYGINESAMGCPVRCGSEAVPVGRLPNGVPVYLDRHAAEADRIVPVNRVKSHTAFHAAVESGLCKMLAVGCGKQPGASSCHNAFLRGEFEETVIGAARLHIEAGRVAAGAAVLENGGGETALVKALPPEELIEAEKKLIRQARQMEGKLPFDQLDCLIVDQIGKSVSGTGMDTNVIGRSNFAELYPPLQRQPKIARIYVRDFAPHSDGNASGLGFADAASARLVAQIDRRVSYMNAFTAKVPQSVKIPPYFEDDRTALQWLLNSLGAVKPEDARVAHIGSTRRLAEMRVSRALQKEAEAHPYAEIVSEWGPMEFGSGGSLAPISPP